MGYYTFLYLEMQPIKVIVEVAIIGLKVTRKYKSVAVPAMLKRVR